MEEVTKMTTNKLNYFEIHAKNHARIFFLDFIFNIWVIKLTLKHEKKS